MILCIPRQFHHHQIVAPRRLAIPAAFASMQSTAAQSDRLEGSIIVNFDLPAEGRGAETAAIGRPEGR